jgi:hypothetical protein
MPTQDTKPPVLSIYNPPISKKPWHFEELVGGRPVNYFAFGRHAMVEAFRLCGVGRGDNVLLPSYICRNVLASIHAVGANPLYYPVRRDLQADFDPDSVLPAKAVLAVNYFGFPQQWDIFEKYRERTQALIIEDNAHGLFSRDEKGRFLGTRPDIGIFSIRKSVPLPNGAALVVNNPELNDNLSEQQSFEISNDDDFFKRKQLIRRHVIGKLGIPAKKIVFPLSRMLRLIMTGSPIPKSDERCEVVLPEPSKCSPFMKKGIKTANPESEVKRRRELYLWLDAWIGRRDNCVPVFENLPSWVVPYGYPFICEEDDLKGLERLLTRKGFYCITWPDLPSAVKESSPSFYKKVRLVPFLW